MHRCTKMHKMNSTTTSLYAVLFCLIAFFAISNHFKETACPVARNAWYIKT